MRAAFALLFLASPAAAQQVWTPAPVPTVSTPGVAPVDRAGSGRADAAGPVSGSPFSAAPPSASPGSSAGGQTSPADRDTPGSTAASTPPLGK